MKVYFPMHNIRIYLLQISWFHGGKDITNNPRYSVTYSSGRCSIEVLSAESSDSGKYTCRAVNKLGEAECGCVVDINGRNL